MLANIRLNAEGRSDSQGWFRSGFILVYGNRAGRLPWHAARGSIALSKQSDTDMHVVIFW
jgi:hypothetical protein